MPIANEFGRSHAGTRPFHHRRDAVRHHHGERRRPSHPGGWAVISDAAPKQIAGLSGALFNMFGNISSITTPIVIGYILQATGSFNGALVFVGANAAVAILSYVVVVGEIKRMELRPQPGWAGQR